MLALGAAVILHQVKEARVSDPTAHIYDLIYEATGKDYQAESAELHRLIQLHHPGAARLLDVACGTGGHLRHLRHWYHVTGVDLSPDMLNEARKHLPDVDLAEADMRTLRLEATFDAVVCLFSAIGYMAGTGELDQAVAAMADHLEPGGILIVDGWIRPDAWHDPGLTHVEVAGTDATKVVRVGRSRREDDTTHLEMHHLIATVDGIEHIVKHHHLTLFAPDHYEAAFRHAGLTVDTIDSPMPGRDRYLGRRPV